MKRKQLSLALAALICLALLPMGAQAAEGEFSIENGVLGRYRGPGGDLVLPAAVTAIEKNAFYGCTDLLSITIPDCVTEIGKMAFQNCTNLRRVTIGNGVTQLEEQLFFGCTGLEEITLGGSVSTLGRAAFRQCTALKSIALPTSLVYIDAYAFEGCTALAQIAIPQGTLVHERAFDGCTALPEGALSDKLPQSAAQLREHAVQKGDFLISGGVLLEYRGSAAEVLVPSEVTNIDSAAFSGCARLERVTIPPTVVKLGRDAFSNCPKLKQIIFPADGKGAQALQYAAGPFFRNCPALTELVNCPIPFISESIAANRTLIETLGDASFYLAPQSARITAVSDQICVGLTDDYEKARAIYTWLAKNIAYDYDYYEGRTKTVITAPEEVLEGKRTICDGYARLNEALLRAQSIPALYVAGATPEAARDHAWNLAFVKDRWIYIDATWAGPGRGGGYDPDWFDPSPLTIALEHRAETSVGGTAPVQGFADVHAGDYCATPVAWAVKGGITSGTAAAAFSPAATCTNAQILTFLWRASGAPEPSIQNPFGDVSGDAYYAKAAIWAHENGLVSGQNFAADTPCTRSQTVTYLWTLAGSPPAVTGGFADVPDGAECAQAVAWAARSGITGGTGKGAFSPDATCTRGQIVTFLYRYFAQ